MENISRRGFLEVLSKGLAASLVVGLPNLAEASTRRQIDVPGIGLVYLDSKLAEDGNFNWSEVTHGGERIPSNRERDKYHLEEGVLLPDEELISRNIYKSFNGMEKIREYFGGRPITITSWYRNPKANKEFGGKPKSRHLYGDAVDFKVQGVHSHEVYKELDAFIGNKGGLGKYNSFTHVDFRGTKVRWDLT